jgi:peptide/nickel transport system substrate-binding protein
VKALPIVLVLSLAAACGGSSSSTGSKKTTTTVTAKDGGTLTYGADQEPTGFNQLTSKDSGTSVVNVMEGVLPSVFRTHPDFTVQLDKDFMVSADLTSQSPETVVYKIKPEAKWSDGVAIDATDFELLWKAQNGTNPKFDVAGTTGYEDIQSVTGSDGGKTVTVVFKKTFPDWKALFSALLPAHIANKNPKGLVEAWNNGFNKTMPVSGGPYSFGTYKPTDSLTLVRNDKYWGPKAHLDSIVFRFLPASTTQPDALKNGEVQMIYPQPQLDLVAQVKGIPGITSETNFGLSFEHLDFNVKTPGLGDLAVRQAIATGLDRTSMLKRTVAQFSDKAQVLGNRIFVNNQKEYVDNGGSYGKGDVAGATKLLDGAGYTKGADGIYAKGGKRLSFRFSTTAGNALRETQGELFKTQMKAIGIEIKIDNSKSSVLFGDRLPKHNFDIADFAWVATPFASSNKGIYSTGGGQNYGQYSNPAVDKAFNDANNILDPQKYVDAYNAIDKQIWADMATIPLYQKPTFIAYSDKYVNIGDNASSEGPFWNVGTWGLK